MKETILNIRLDDGIRIIVEKIDKDEEREKQESEIAGLESDAIREAEDRDRWKQERAEAEDEEYRQGQQGEEK